MYGLGWRLALQSPHPAIGGNGGGRAAFFVYRKDDLAVIVLTDLIGSDPPSMAAEGALRRTSLGDTNGGVDDNDCQKLHHGIFGGYRTMKIAGKVKVLFVAGFGPIVREMATSRKLYSEALGIPFKEESGGYLHTEALQGAKHSPCRLFLRLRIPVLVVIRGLLTLLSHKHGWSSMLKT
jgi:hypothetical protein